MEPNPSNQVLANRFRMGVTLGVIALCAVAILGFRALQSPSDLNEPESHRASSQHKPTNRGMTAVGEVHFDQHAQKKASVPSPDHPQVKAEPYPARANESPLVMPNAALSSPPKTSEPATASRSASDETSPGAKDAYGTGTIIGRVVLEGTPPPGTPITVTDPNCGKGGAGPPPNTPWYRVASDGGLGDVFVYVSGGLPEVQYLPPEKPLLLDQIGCWFFPYISGAQVGQTILVRNSDKALHNVHWTPSVAGNKESNKAQLPGGADQAYAFGQPEVFVRLKCDVHPWMFSYVGLVNHPFFAVTDDNGAFAIRNLPPGKFELSVVHRKSHPTGKGLTVTVVVEDGKVTQTSFTIEVK